MSAWLSVRGGDDPEPKDVKVGGARRGRMVATPLEQFALTVATFYADDPMPPSIAVAKIGPPASWYVAVHRFPGGPGSRSVPCYGSAGTLDTAIADCESEWMNRRNRDPVLEAMRSMAKVGAPPAGASAEVTVTDPSRRIDLDAHA